MNEAGDESPNPPDYAAAHDAARRRMAEEMNRRILEDDCAEVLMLVRLRLAVADLQILCALANRDGASIDEAASRLVAGAVAGLDMRTILGGGAP